VDRGTCTFATKSYYAELAGASGVIIVDTKSGSTDFDHTVITDD
jgi:hypothetical protein